MAEPHLNQNTDYVAIFNQATLANLDYLQRLPAVQTLDPAVLDQERESLLRTIRFALTLDPAWPLACRLIETVSPYMERRGYWTIWEQLLQQAVMLARQRDDTVHGVTLSLLLARLMQRQSNLSATVRHYRQTLYFARRSGDQYNEARVCTNLGYLFIESGQWWRAEVLCRYALTIFEQLKSQHGLAHTHNHLGILYTRQHCWRCAQHHLEKACEIWSLMGDEHGLMRGCINLSSLYLELKSTVQARYYLTEALARAKATGEEIEIATVYLGLCVSCRIEGNPAQAERYAHRAETIFRRFCHTVGLAQARDNLGLVCLDQGKWTKAEQHFAATLRQWRELNSNLGELRVLTYLVEYELARHNPAAAALYLKQLEAKMAQPQIGHRFLQPKLNYYRYRLAHPLETPLLAYGAAILGAMTSGLFDHFYFNLTFIHIAALYWLTMGLGVATVLLWRAETE